MFYREGMPGSILFTGVAAVVYFVVGIRFENSMLLASPTSVGKFTVLFLIQLFTAGMVYVYCKNRSLMLQILLYCIGATVLAVLVSVYVVPFDVVWVQLVLTALMIGVLLWKALGTRIRNYYFIVLFAIGSMGFFYSADYVLNHVM